VAKCVEMVSHGGRWSVVGVCFALFVVCVGVLFAVLCCVLFAVLFAVLCAVCFDAGELINGIEQMEESRKVGK
jgi:hypothetical protein